MDSPICANVHRANASLSRRSLLRGLGGASIALALPLLQACSSAPAAPTAAPPTIVPKPTDVLPTPSPVTQASATTAPQATAAPATATPQPAAPTVTPKAATTAQLPAQEITLGMPDYQPWIETLKPMLGEDFKQSQPNVKVTVNQYPGTEMRTKYRLLATSGTPLDVSWVCCGDVATFGELKLLLNLDPLLKQDNIDPKIYFPGSLWEGYFDPNTKYIGSGNLLALPVTFVFTLTYYNKDMFQKAKVDEPKYDWTWDDLVKIGQQLTIDKNGKKPTDAGFDKENVTQYGLGGAQWSEYDFVIGAGGRYVTPENKVVIDTPETIKGVQFVQDMIHKYRILPVPSAAKNMPQFPTGKTVAISKDGSWNFTPWTDKITDFKWDVAPLPIGPIGKRVGYGGSNQFSSWTGVKHPDAAWELLKFLASPAITLKYWGIHGIPSVKESALSPELSKIAKFTEKMAKISAEAGAYIQSSDPTIRREEWGTALDAELTLVWEGKQSAADACKKAQEKVAAIMARTS
jgi:multiple sugar transport system substrate-binding protein